MENWSFLLGTTDLWTLQQVILSRATSSTPTVSYYHCLQTHYMPEEHTAANIRGALSETLQLETQLVEIVIDSSSKVCELLKWKRLIWSQFESSSCWMMHVSNELFIWARVLSPPPEVGKTAGPYFYSKAKRSSNPQAEGRCSYLLGSSYEMVERLIEQMEAGRVLFASDRKTSYMIPTWQGCDVLNSTVKPLNEMTDALSKEKCVTVSAVKLLLNYM